MKHLLAPALLLLAASPAAAHDGAHLHPHGAETVVGSVLFLVTAAAVAWLAFRR